MSLADLNDRIEMMRVRLETRQNEFAELEAELVDLRREMEDFEREYYHRVGRIDEEIAQLDKEIERLRHARIADAYGDADPYADWRFGWKPPEDYVNASEQYKRARSYTPPKKGGLMDRIHGGSAATVEDSSIKKLYRQLARRFHPDLAENEAERAYRTQIMGQINEAYAARRIDELRGFIDVPEKPAALQAEREPPPQIRLQQLEKLYRELGAKIEAMKRERDRRMHGPMIELQIDAKLARRQGRDLIKEMAAAAQRELEEKQRELEELRRGRG